MNRSVSLEGITNTGDSYYQNLIVQDIAIASQQSLSEISLRFDYNIRYITDQCTRGLLDIRVLPIAVKCFPLNYYGYDISGSIKPEKADLVFYLIQRDGYISDSLIFFDIPLEKDSSLYTSMTAARDTNDRNFSVTFARAIFHYTKSSYEIFRDRILQIDEYYAASMLADSILVWTAGGILSETGNKAEMIIRQLETERIIRYIRPEKFAPVFAGGVKDINGLNSKYLDLLRINNRMTAIVSYDHFEKSRLSRIINKNELLKNYLDRFDHYHMLAYKSDFRFVNFIDGLANPAFSNASLRKLQEAFSRQRDLPDFNKRKWCNFLAQGLIDRGSGFELAGNQPRALSYYESAYSLSKLVHLHDHQSHAFQLLVRMKNDIAASFIEISRKSALTENPAMAAQYFHDALDLFADKDLVYLDGAWLKDYEQWLFLNFASQVVKCIEMKNYSKALIYLNEIQNQCRTSSSYPCPDQFHEWMRSVHEGIYHDLLIRATNLLASDELQEAEQLFRQATEMRMRAGYRIEKDKSEDDLERRFLQILYDELIEKGQTNFNKEEFSNALYYFDEANFQERNNILRPCPDLFSYRQAAARKVMETILSDGRLKAWAYDLEGAGIALEQVKRMLSEYSFAEIDTLSLQYSALNNYYHQNECEKVYREFNDLMLKVQEAKESNDFILALKIAEDAVNLSMDNLGCRIRDDDAWYQKVVLESPADFQQKEKMLEKFNGTCNEYLLAFQDLKSFYYQNKLLDLGVVFIPLYDRVIKLKDSLLLTGMVGHYITLKDFDNAFHILDRLRELGYSPAPLSGQQKALAEALARRDAMNSDSEDPRVKLESYTGQDKWYREFADSYKHTWLQTTSWKIKYWPLIWKK